MESYGGEGAEKCWKEECMGGRMKGHGRLRSVCLWMSRGG